MPSAKKRRGKQRKKAAAASAAAAAPRVAGGGRTRQYGHYHIDRSEPGVVIEAISRGEIFATEFVTYDLCGYEGDDVAKAFVEHLVDDGLIRIGLDFVNQCKLATVAEAVTGQGAPIREVASHPVVDPSIWICLLACVITANRLPTKESTDRCRMELAHGIGPLISCMRSPSREFFKSKEHWYHGLQPLMYLINNIAVADEAIDTLFEHKGLDDMLAQSLFLRTHRPDIVEESNVFGRLDFQWIADSAVIILDLAIASWKKRTNGRVWYFDESATRRLNSIGRTPIVSKPYRTNGRVPLVIGMIEQLQSQQHQSSLSQFFCILRAFIDVGCVDKNVISAALRSAHMLGYNAAAMITNILVAMLNQVGGESTPCDNRFAFAIDQGLLIVSLNVLVGHQNVRHGSLLNELQTLLERAFSVSTQMKTAKAINRQRNKVFEMICQSERALAKRSEGSQKMLRLVKMIVLLQENIESYTPGDCCFLSRKRLAEEEIKGCCTIYCSQSCQREDWARGGHEDICANDAIQAECKAAKREEMLSRNACAVVEKLVNENHLGLLNEFSQLENDALDCVVLINLVRPPVIQVLSASSYLSAKSGSDMGARFKQQIDKNRANGAVTSVTRYRFCTPHEADQAETVIMGHLQRTGSWQDALEEFKKRGSLLDASDRELLFFRY